MLFTALPIALLSIAGLVTAVPHPKAEAGLGLVPRSVEVRQGRNSFINNINGLNLNFFNSFVDQSIIIINDAVQRSAEVEFLLNLQDQVRRRNGQNNEIRDRKDNIRRNHFRSQNRNVNTVIVIVTEVQDFRNSNRQSSRFMRRDILADNGFSQQQTVIIKEVQVITIDSNSNNQRMNHLNNINNIFGSVPTPVFNLNDFQAQASAAALSSIQNVGANSNSNASSNQTVMLPQGQGIPNFASSVQDPAAILEVDVQNVQVQIIA